MRPLLFGLAVADFLPGGRSLADKGPMVCSGREERITICEAAPCDTGPACEPVNGEWGEWSDWSTCSCSGVKERHRPVAQHGACGGVQVEGPEIEATFCQPTCDREEPKVCELSLWGDWSACDKDCGGGIKTRSRTIEQQSKNCGQPCTDALMESESCAMHDCGVVVPCEVGDWTEWSACDRDCNGGQQRRKRSLSEPSGGGEGCHDEPLEETRGCNTECCPGDTQHDCAWGDWADWSGCSASCDGGHRNRARVIAQSPTNGGKPCTGEPVMEWGSCNMERCNPPSVIDGAWGDWSEWSSCSRDCGTGYRSRGRSIASEPENGGKPATGPAQVYEECNLGSCEADAVDCAFGDWQPWGACSATFKGTMARSRVILRYAERGGKGCSAALAQVTTCNVMSLEEMRGPTIDCAFGDWDDWAVCSKSCGGGTTTRQRGVMTPASNGGVGCEGSVHAAKPCHEEVCNAACDQDKDCAWAAWGAWSACTVTCGGGETMRYRTVAQPAMNMGKECVASDSRQVAPCSPTPCGTERFCVWGDWSEPDACSAVCGPGTQRRTRDLEIAYSKPSEGEAIDTSILAAAPKAPAFLPAQALVAAGAGFATVLLTAAALGRARGPRRSLDRE